ncbi:MAG TPA: GGDEF domain-containing protein [Pseudonocardiaceae bacterium]|nr:GGDEF domain-containing protein [Pseudonocardiaceae bacterium]
MLVYVLAGELVAAVVLIAIALNHPSATRLDWIRLAFLAGCAIAHIDLTRGVERVRNITAGAGPSLDTKSVWSFAAVIILPPTMAAGMVILTHTWAWLRVWRGRRPLYRWVYSTATVLLGTQVAIAILASGPGPHHAIPTTLAGFGVVAAAAALRWLVNYTLVAGVIMVANPSIRAGQVLHTIDERILEIGAFGLGFVAAGAAVANPLLLIGVVLGLTAMHRGVLLPQLRIAASIDPKTGLHTVTWWHPIAEQALERAVALHTSLGLLMLDLDHFKRVNDTHGHMAGDHVLRAVAEAVQAEVRDHDIACRWGGEEFVVLLPDLANATELRTIAERVRCRIRTLIVAVPTDDGMNTIQNLTISIGAVLYPGTHPVPVDELLRIADVELYKAKNLGRDRVEISPARPAAIDSPAD